MSFLPKFIVSVAIVTIAAPLLAAERLDLSPHYRSNSAVHVTIDLDAGGHNLVRNQTDTKPEEGKDPATANDTQKLPSSVSAKLSYDEVRLGDAANAEEGTALAVRYYDNAEAVIKVDNAGRTPKLADEHRIIVLEQADPRPLLFCPGAPLEREQLDLIDVVGDSFSADRLLPDHAVAEGDTWKNDTKAMAPLLTLDSVAVCEVESVLDSSNDSFAKIRLAGTVHGTADGAAVEEEVRGVYLFDRKQHRVTRLNLAVKEKRSIGGATPGLDAVAKVQIVIAPIEKSSHLDPATIEQATRQTRQPEGDLSFEAPTMGFRLKHDRQWYVTSEARQSVTLRRVDNGDLAAQCTVTQLPPKSEGRQTTLEQFQDDIKYALGQNFGEFVSNKQWQNAAGLYCYEVVVRGFTEELPVEWHYFLASPTSGNRLAISVTIEKAMVDRVGAADRELVESLQLFPAMPAAKTAAQPTGEAVR